MESHRRIVARTGIRILAAAALTLGLVVTTLVVPGTAAAQRTDAVAGTDFTFDDLRSFAGIVPQYEWQCLGEMKMIAPMNTKVKAYPYEKEHNFGPYGLSFADDRWELRDVVLIRMKPKNTDHPYHHKDIYIDKETLTSLYSFAYDQKEELWKIIWHNKRWSGDDSLTGDWYPGWEDVPEPRDLLIVSDIIANVQTGTGNPHRVLGPPRHALQEQGADPTLPRRRASHEGPLTPAG